MTLDREKKYIKKLFRGDTFEKIDPLIVRWMNRNGFILLRVFTGIVFFWFGILKFFPGLSPAQELATKTIDLLTFRLIPPFFIINGLALWEVLIGLGLVTGKFIRVTLFLLFLQMAGTFAPIFLFPHEVFSQIPYAPTLEGQYIIKNIVLVAAGIVLGGSLKISKNEAS
jgi:uncharacterized membrane protein YphA (DoxX/SURF4 family)